MHFAVVLLLVACTHARPISTPSGLVGKRVTVETYDGAKVSVVVQHTTTGVTYRGPFDDVDPATVTRITEARRGRGALEGLGIGALSGATIGAVIGFALGEDDCASPSFCGYRVTAVEKAGIVGAFGAGVGGLVGAFIGYARGSRFVYSNGEQMRVVPNGPPGSVAGVTITY